MSKVEPLSFDEFIDLLRRRLGDADAINPSGAHFSSELMEDYAEVTPQHWYHEAFDELEAQGHLDVGASRKTSGNAVGRLSADGRWYLRAEGSEGE